jgi:hypothetical protein
MRVQIMILKREPRVIGLTWIFESRGLGMYFYQTMKYETLNPPGYPIIVNTM